MAVNNAGKWVLLVVFASYLNIYVECAQAKGNPHVEIVVKSGRTNKLHPLRSVDNITLWCQAEENGAALPIKSAKFVRKKDNEILKATISEDGKRASHNFGPAAVEEAGNYTCKITTATGIVSGNHQVFVRPVLMVAESERVDMIGNDAFRFEGTGVSAVAGRNVNITCPVIAFPNASHTWTKDGKPLTADGEHVRLTPDGVVQLLNVNNDDRGVYECTAKNKYTINGRTEVSEVILSRRLRVKSELAWLWPLIVIIAIVALLVLIIFVCECRKKRAEQKLLEAEADE
uniref:Ig-like domain-containing protein n=2 Tax=Parascaris univalens TaxID=6257 RepID=A0A915BD33_PARUN